MHTIRNTSLRRSTIGAVSALFVAGAAFAQSTADTEIDDEDIVVLSPFEVSAEEEQGYTAATTLAGNRLNTELRDIGNAVTVVTKQFLDDIAATDNESLLQYTTGTEVGNIGGNFAGFGDGSRLDESSRFANPNQNTRVRGLAAADNTRDFFATSIPWDGYSIDRVDLQRGPNSILFGQGSPAGIINSGSKQASFKNSHEVAFRVGSYGSARASVDFNRVLLEDQLAVRVAALKDDTRYQQDPAFQDSERIFAAVRFEPEFLKRGSARTILKASFEDGAITSNRPRTLPPLDYITPWFYTGTYQGVQNGQPRSFNNLNGETFNAFQLRDDNTGRPNHGQTRPAINGGPDAGSPNPSFNPWVGGFANAFESPFVYFDGNGGVSPSLGQQSEIRDQSGEGGRADDGTIDDNVSLGFHRMGGVNSYSNYAVRAELPYAQVGVYKDNSLTDPSVFDFYNNLIDGPNKGEWQNFDSFNISLAQTFMNDKFGVEIVFNQESYDNGQLSLLSGANQGLFIDFNSVYSDGTAEGIAGAAPDGRNEPFADGTPNSNVGRPFVGGTSGGGNNSFVSERDGFRATAFFTHDFAREGNPSTLKRLLGKHTLTGLVASESQDTDTRRWIRYNINREYMDFLGGDLANNNFNSNYLQPHSVIYLGDSLLNASTAAGANIPRVTTRFDMPRDYAIRVFDMTWNAGPDVGFDDEWLNPYYPDISPFNDYDDPTTPDTDETGSRIDTQANNIANYVGWRYEPVTITDSEDNNGANRDAHTTFARLTRNEVDSEAFVWQAHFWDNAVVGTYGWRKDVARAWSTSADTNTQADGSSVGPADRLKLTGDIYKIDPDGFNEIEVESNSFSIVAHLDQLPLIKDATERLPFLTTVFYNKSENFQPAAERVDVYGVPLDAPAGTTTDAGFLIESKSGRFSLKVNKYETEVVRSSSSALSGVGFIGNSQAWSGNWVNRFEFNLRGNTIDTQGADDDDDNGRYNFGAGQNGEDAAAAAVREQNVIAAWRAWQASVDPRFYEAWGIDLVDWQNDGISATQPAGFTVTEDAISKGYEIEFNAQPTRNWRLTLNASKTTAVRKNIGGENLNAFIDSYEAALNEGADGGVGDLRIWWGGAGNERALFQWNTNVGAEYAARKLQEGTNVPELREWRLNAISNYDFDEGILKGVNVGGAIRWQDDVVVGFPPIPHPTIPTKANFDLTNPYRGPAETNLDLWVGYSRQLSEKIDWRVQLNVRNVGQGNNLIPVTVQPDGTPATYRIGPHQSWTLTNTFKF
ncbi:TonB-dependent receptor plug domain-containing protein [Synoicihabitans lomoniglobus]|uniref:TonB-dependent receptor plug domain-containing protein n=1 Tax=Synoicihabitans lomoniglobus TaxID=2909285 RepID=A0AAE9ZYU5_9BACT|nr:TonB-dependent receptor plug domain-containing protein [Opitutaceae bacterium LMO-M01]WED65138.1 TonB-dependent receptor plug domain-containing protein [Opitutaceae bacterium LMO-M01]